MTWQTLLLSLDLMLLSASNFCLVIMSVQFNRICIFL
jgi:hypothetical protein